MELARYPLRRVAEDPLAPMDRGRWPADLAPVRQLLDEGLDLGRATVLVGANGVGKSTLVEGIALAYGLSPEGGSTWARNTTRATESDLADHLRLERNAGALKSGYFLRAETMHGFFTYLEDRPRAGDPSFHELSHGESFLALFESRTANHSGLWVLDEPESALSFDGSLALLGMLTAYLRRDDAQVILSTHSPILAALPGATIWEVGAWGMTPRTWERLEFVASWRRFFENPDAVLAGLDG